MTAPTLVRCSAPGCAFPPVAAEADGTRWCSAVVHHDRRIECEEPGHHICGDRCAFIRHTHVGRWCISTVGEQRSLTNPGAFEEIGSGRLYETMVFDLTRSEGELPGRRNEVDSDTYNDCDAATAGHEALVERWAGRSEVAGG